MEQAVIDRLEGDRAVLLVGEEQRPIDVPRRRLPRRAREGHWLLVEVVEDQVVSARIDRAATKAARRRIQEKLERLRRGEHLTG